MKKIFFLTTILLLTSLAINAKDTYTWKQYGLSFSVPEDFDVLKNNEESFEAENDEIYLSIEVLDYDGLTPEFFGELLGQMAISSEMEDAEVGELRLTTLEGAYIEGVVGASNVIYVILLDTDSNIALIASIVYEDGNERAATNIVNSFAIK
ncbi:hypothetical protein LJC06_04190 [Bacteroidales bacterium OttesenSCG-928-I14]|nr:hypothetical protein [Bacteroidales bacterium OttesenSCG-928-I14]